MSKTIISEEALSGLKVRQVGATEEKRAASISAKVAEAKRKFANDPVMRVVLYAHFATLESRENPYLSPKVISTYLVGHAGYGKTSKMRQVALDMGWAYREVQVGGITDVAEVTGMVRTIDVKREDGTIDSVTKLCPPEWWPTEHDPEGILCLDDYTRALPHVSQA